MKRFLFFVILLALASPAFAQHECDTIPANTLLTAVDSSGIVHQVECWNALTGELTFPLTPAGGSVTSVFGRTGAVVAASGDYTCSQVTNCPTGTSGELAGGNPIAGLSNFVFSGPTLNIGVLGSTNGQLNVNSNGSSQVQFAGGSMTAVGSAFDFNAASGFQLVFADQTGTEWGSPTGGSEGPNTINVAGNFFVNGVAVGSTFASSITIPAAGVTFSPSSGSHSIFLVPSGKDFKLADPTHDFIDIGPFNATGESGGIFLSTAGGAQFIQDCTYNACGPDQNGYQFYVPTAATGLASTTGFGIFSGSTLSAVTDFFINGATGIYTTEDQVAVSGPGHALMTGNSRLVARSSALSTTTVFTNNAFSTSAAFRINAAVYCDSSASGATATLTVTYQDVSGTTQTVTGSGAACTTLGSSSLQQISIPAAILEHNGTVTWAVAIAGSPTYDGVISVEALSLN